MLDYEKLDVYRCAIDHLAFAFQAIERLPRGTSTIADQWRRAAMSIPLNIAEAAGKKSVADRENRYAIARGEAMECGALLDVVAVLGLLPAEQIRSAKENLERVVRMLSKMCR